MDRDRICDDYVPLASPVYRGIQFKGNDRAMSWLIRKITELGFIRSGPECAMGRHEFILRI